MSLLITGARLLDPVSRADRMVDVRVDGDTVTELAEPGCANRDDAQIIDAKGKWLLPGFWDLHTQLGEPGYEYKEDIPSGTAAAAAGGYTDLVTSPATDPVVDQPELVDFIRRRGQQAERCRVWVATTLSVGGRGQTLAPFGDLAEAGAVAVGDTQHVVDGGLMRSALEYAQHFGLCVLRQGLEPGLAKGGQVREGTWSTRLGLRGVPALAEEIALARDLALAAYTGGRLHVAHLSTAAGVRLVREAKARGIQVTADVAATHLVLTAAATEDYNVHAKVWPPLGEEEDRAALLEGLRDGTIDAIASGHCPQSTLEKDNAFADAAFGAIGLETTLAMVLGLWRDQGVPLLDLIARLSSGPARVIGQTLQPVGVGREANLALIDPEENWDVTAANLRSKSSNTPFFGRTLQGRSYLTLCRGQITFHHHDVPRGGAQRARE